VQFLKPASFGHERSVRDDVYSRRRLPATRPPILEAKTKPAKLSLEEDLRKTGGEMVRLLPVAGAVGLGALYLVGAMMKVGQLQASDVSVSDALPLVPLSQLLASALPVLVPSVVLLPLSVWLLNWWWRAVEVVGARWRRVDSALTRATARARSISVRLDELERDPSRSGVEALRGDMSALDADFARLGRMKPVVMFLGRKRRLGLALLTAVAVAYVAVMLTASPTELFAVTIGVAAVGALRHRPFLAGAAVYGVFCVAVLFEAYTAPANLPIASVRTTDHRLERGRLIAATDAQWHLAVGHGAIRSIPTARIVASRVDPGGGGGSGSIWKQLRDLVA
jgi:hypothetical protein